MKNLLLAILFSLFVNSFGIANAQEEQWIVSPPPTFELAEPAIMHYDESSAPGARFYTLRAGERTQYAGILLNAEANAWIIAQYQYIQRYWITEMNRRVELTLSWGNSEIAGLRARNETDIAALNVRVETLQRENEMLTSTTDRLIRQNRRQRFLYRFLFSSISITAVAATTTTAIVLTR